MKARQRKRSLAQPVSQGRTKGSKIVSKTAATNYKIVSPENSSLAHVG
jgi:hypothetical protein